MLFVLISLCSRIFENVLKICHWLAKHIGPFFRPLWAYLVEISRPKIKWVLRRMTGLTELQRICYGEPVGGPRSLAVEASMMKSRQADMKKLVKFLDRAAEEGRFSSAVGLPTIITNSAQAVYQIKSIRAEVHPHFGKALGSCVSHIWGYRDLLHILERLRTTPYDSDNPEHENQLAELWRLMMPNETLKSRISDQWKDVGFQGDDPMTDFRGMGVLGLENLLYFAKEHQGAALHVLSHSNHPKYGYSYAIVGINLTSMALNLWKGGAAKTHVYNYCHRHNIQRYDLDLFHQFYCYLFFEFDKLWLSEKPATIMEFSRIRDMFETRMKLLLADPKIVLKLNFAIDTI